MSTYLITGASRGLGLALVRHLANLPSTSVGTIFATSRSEHPSLKELSQQSDRIKWVKCDVTDAESVHDAIDNPRLNDPRASLQRLANTSVQITKAALNMLTVQYAQDYGSEGFTFLAVSPGWLQTEMGGSRADLPPATGAKAVLDIVQKATPSQNGKALNIHVPGWEENEGLNQYDGKEVPW
ncbi:hypothetical protein CNMCM6936_007626 [Aspergillus lentulus]|nr:hypothetical protein CNMCM6936_007626 [Aspergillus lentulus]